MKSLWHLDPQLIGHGSQLEVQHRVAFLHQPLGRHIHDVDRREPEPRTEILIALALEKFSQEVVVEPRIVADEPELFRLVELAAIAPEYFHEVAIDLIGIGMSL